MFACNCSEAITAAVVATFFISMGAFILIYIILRAVMEHLGQPRLDKRSTKDGTATYASRRSRRKSRA